MTGRSFVTLWLSSFFAFAWAANGQESVVAATNDQCSQAMLISGEGVFSFDNSGPVTLDAPSHSSCTNVTIGTQFLSDVWYCWTSTCDGPVTIDTCGTTTVDSKLAVYQGCGCPQSQANLAACDDDGCVYQSRVTVQAVAGGNYTIRIATSPQSFVSGGEGSFTIRCEGQQNLPCTQPTRNCRVPDSWNAFASDGTKFRSATDFRVLAGGDITNLCWWGTYVDESADCSPGAGDSFEVRYFVDEGGQPGNLLAGPFTQQDDSLNVTGPVRTFKTLEGGTHQFQYSATHAPFAVLPETCYWVEITNAAHHSTSPTCQWMWQVAQSDSGRSAQDGTAESPPDGYDSFDLRADDLSLCLNLPLSPVRSNCGSGPTNDSCSNATSISDGEWRFDTRGALTDYECDSFPYSCLDLPLGQNVIHRDVWFHYTATCSGTIRVNACDADFDAALAVYPNAECPPSPYAVDLSNDDGCGGETFLGPRIELPGKKGETYAIRVGGMGTGARNRTCYVERTTAGCGDAFCEDLVCVENPSCCTTAWSNSCRNIAQERCLGSTGVGTLLVECIPDQVPDHCGEIEVQSVPHVFEDHTSQRRPTCPLVPAQHDLVAFTLRHVSTVTLEYCGSVQSPAEVWPTLFKDCPCQEMTSEGVAGVCDNGKPRLTWECLEPGVYYYPILDPFSGYDAYKVAVSESPCFPECKTAAGDCHAVHAEPGCSAESCCLDVCEYDPYCCTTTWDALCAGQATTICNLFPYNACRFAEGDCRLPHPTAGCEEISICERVCGCDPFCCEVEWDMVCVGILFTDEDGCGNAVDCNGNGVPDEMDIGFGHSIDCDGNGFPDECEDCNGNEIGDACDIAADTSRDCDANGKPDECDLAISSSVDCNGNAILDECEVLPQNFALIPTMVEPLASLLSLAAADMDADGDRDLIVIENFKGPSVAIYFNDGKGTFSSPTRYTWPEVTLLSLVSAADLDGNGFGDLVFVDPQRFGTPIVVRLNVWQGGSMVEFGLSPIEFEAESVGFGDMDRDGDPDLVSSPTAPVVSIFLNRGDGTFEEPIGVESMKYSGGKIAVGDLNDDTYPDLVVSDSSYIEAYLNLGRMDDVWLGVAPSITYPLQATQPFDLTLADVTADGITDLVIGFEQTILAFRNNGVGESGEWVGFTPFPGGSLPTSTNSRFQIAADDLNGDSYVDVAVTREDPGGVSILLNRGAAGFENDCDCLSYHLGHGCEDESCMALVCSQDPSCCYYDYWDHRCANAAFDLCACGNLLRLTSGVFGNAVVMSDLTGDNVADLAYGGRLSVALNQTRLPLGDDCNRNRQPDDCDIDFGTSLDCNVNAVPDECDVSTGKSDDCNSNVVPDECESLAVFQSSIPPAGSIDARQPHDPEGSNPSGWTEVAAFFSAGIEGATVSDFAVTTSDNSEIHITHVITEGKDAVIRFDRPIPAGAVTTLRYSPGCTSICLGFLPGDVDGDGTSSPRDILHLIDCLNGLIPCESWQCDLDRSMECGPSDILREIDLLLGAEMFDSWLHRSIPTCP